MVNIQCANKDCEYNKIGFIYKFDNDNSQLSNEDDLNAYDLRIECPNRHENKIWINGLDIDIDEVADQKPAPRNE